MLSSDAKSCVKGDVFQCYTYNAQSKCATCIAGFYLSATNTCLPLPAGCLAANTTGACLKCQSETFFLQDGKCVRVAAPVLYCAEYSSLTTCGRCQPGYTLYTQSNTCEQS